MKEIAIRGYYGFGNLGDDVLMLTSMRLAKEVFPEHKQILCTEHPEPKYLKHLAPGIPVINQSFKQSVDLFFHGGGGVHFDFSEGSLSYSMLNRFVKMIGYNSFSKIYRSFRKYKGTNGLEFKYQLGAGIGVGTFSYGSRKFYQSILKLNDYDLLLVRDPESKQNVRELNLRIPCEVFTDLAFYTEPWRLFMTLLATTVEHCGFNGVLISHILQAIQKLLGIARFPCCCRGSFLFCTIRS